MEEKHVQSIFVDVVHTQQDKAESFHVKVEVDSVISKIDEKRIVIFLHLESQQRRLLKCELSDTEEIGNRQRKNQSFRLSNHPMGTLNVATLPHRSEKSEKL